jgi:putative drug exporter of the RND superfamily
MSLLLVLMVTPGSAETIGLLAAIAVILLAFGSVVAMGLPIIAALVGVGLGFGILEALSHLVTVPTFGPDMMVMIGLGVGIDYALLIVTRYRQSLAEGHPPRDATIVALSTAGRAVLFAGSTVLIALCGLFVVGLGFMDGLAVATIIAGAWYCSPRSASCRRPSASPVAPSTGSAFPACSPAQGPPNGEGSGPGGAYGAATPLDLRWRFLRVLAVLAVPLFSMRTRVNQKSLKPRSPTDQTAGRRLFMTAVAAGAGPSGSSRRASAQRAPSMTATRSSRSWCAGTTRPDTNSPLLGIGKPRAAATKGSFSW